VTARFYPALGICLHGAVKEDLPRSRKSKRRKEKGPEAPNFQERMVKMAQILSNLSKNFFDCEPKVRFDFAVKKFLWVKFSASSGVWLFS
jgi:hypothetical protein